MTIPPPGSRAWKEMGWGDVGRTDRTWSPPWMLDASAGTAHGAEVTASRLLELRADFLELNETDQNAVLAMVGLNRDSIDFKELERLRLLSPVSAGIPSPSGPMMKPPIRTASRLQEVVRSRGDFVELDVGEQDAVLRMLNIRRDEL
jgi:hypothetical protein